MGGDGASGLAMAIGIAMVLMVLGSVGAFVLIARALKRWVRPTLRVPVVVAMVVVGAGIGWVLVMATFYESSWSPPPQLSLATPPGFTAPAVLLLEDPRAPGSLEWHDSWLPFTTPTATANIPPSGILRVRSFGLIAGRADADVVWPDGIRTGPGGGPGPPGTGANSFIMIRRPDAPVDHGLDFEEGPALAAYVAQREQRR
jgi:hypothetical protein